MEWSVINPPTSGKSHYNHITSKTPLGEVIIEWKSWKTNPSYDIQINNEWIGCKYDMDEAKKFAFNFIETKYNELKVFVDSNNNQENQEK